MRILKRTYKRNSERSLRECGEDSAQWLHGEWLIDGKLENCRENVVGVVWFSCKMGFLVSLRPVWTLLCMFVCAYERIPYEPKKLLIDLSTDEHKIAELCKMCDFWAPHIFIHFYVGICPYRARTFLPNIGILSRLHCNIYLGVHRIIATTTQINTCGCKCVCLLILCVLPLRMFVCFCLYRLSVAACGLCTSCDGIPSSHIFDTNVRHGQYPWEILQNKITMETVTKEEEK